MSSFSDLKVMKQMANTIKIQMAREFRYMSTTCKHRVRDGHRLVCKNKKHFYSLLAYAVCNEAQCPKAR